MKKQKKTYEHQEYKIKKPLKFRSDLQNAVFCLK